MKRTSIVMVLLAATLCVSAFAAHTPVPGPNFAGCPDEVTKFGGYPKFQMKEIVSEIRFLAPGGYDFCRLMDNIYCSLSLIANLNSTIMDFAELVQCLTMDINGPIDTDAKIPVSANGVLDSYELAILAHILNSPNHELFEVVNTAWEANFTALKELVVAALKVATLKKSDDTFDKDITGVVDMMAPALAPSLVGVLAGFATLGDATTNEALNELVGLLSDIGLEPPEGGIASITTGVPDLGPQGDIDGDGYTNMEEFLYFVNQMEYTLDQYVSAAFDPNAMPPSYDPIVKLERSTGLINVGDNVTIRARLNYYYDLPNFVKWYKDGVLIDGEEELSLSLLNVQIEDSGAYTVVVGITVSDDEDKGEEELTATTLLNVSTASLPVAGLAGMGLLVGVVALAGARRFRRG